MEKEAVDKADHRLQQLEKQVRDARTIALAGVAGVVALCLFSLVWVLTGGLSGEIRAKRFAVLHDNGKPGVLLTVRNDNPTLSLYDVDGDLRAVFELQGKGQPILTFLDKERHYRSVIGLSDEGNPGIAFWDSDYRARANFKLAQGRRGGAERRPLSVGRDRADPQLPGHEGAGLGSGRGPVRGPGNPGGESDDGRPVFPLSGKGDRIDQAAAAPKPL
jgi:hypothetical protein